ncbi:MAG: SDR family NAD(P)-dependent oxidoreductase [Epsilonproteobacteria bacterium]|nr:SDR family NAD(P)-dependent oxidoreductase [Campylobacterota bacterium]
MSSKKVILITGASSGIGRACAYFLAKQGFIVYAGSRTPHKLEKTDGALASLTINKMSQID